MRFGIVYSNLSWHLKNLTDTFYEINTVKTPRFLLFPNEHGLCSGDSSTQSLFWDPTWDQTDPKRITTIDPNTPPRYHAERGKRSEPSEVLRVSLTRTHLLWMLVDCSLQSMFAVHVNVCEDRAFYGALRNAKHAIRDSWGPHVGPWGFHGGRWGVHGNLMRGHGVSMGGTWGTMMEQ